MWRRNTQCGGHVRKKLDRVMSNSTWRLTFPNALVEFLPMHNSDLNLMYLHSCKFVTRKILYFHFQVDWLGHLDYGDIVKKAW